jgi:hypothetical protein
MLERRFTYVKTSGARSDPVSRARILLVASRLMVAHAGPFTVFRAEGYKHPGLQRVAALERIAAMTRNVIVGERITARDKHGELVFDARREKLSPYANPLRDCVGIRGLREDQGVDYSVTQRSPVYAIGPGIITIYRPTSGWPWDPTHADGGAYIAYKLTEGPAAGKYVYDAEHIQLVTGLKVGDVVSSAMVIAHHLPGFANCEMGWALPSNQGYSPLAVGYYREGDRTAAGANFDDFMTELGAPAGLTEGRAIRGTNPADFPKSWAGQV